MNKKNKLLLVEDEALIAMNEANDLGKEGYDVIIAYSGQDAIDEIKKDPGAIHLVLMDIDLGPGMDGTAAAKEIQKIQDIPIVFLSSHIEKAIVDRTETITSYGYVVKNSGITVLSASIKMAFRLHEAHLSIREQSMEIETANEELRSTVEELEKTNRELTRSQRELTEREQAIAESEAMLSAAFRSNPDSVALTEIGTGKIIDLNPAFEAWSGYSRDEIIGKTTHELGIWAHPEDRDAMVNELRRHGRFKDMNVLLRHKSGATRTVLLSGQTMMVGGKNALYTSARDVTDTRLVEAALRESEEKNRAMLNSIPDLMFMLDSNGVFIDWKGPEETLAMSPDLFIGKSIGDVMPGIADLVMDRIRALGTSSLEIIEYSLKMGGENRRYEARMVKAGEGRVMTMVRDITERKKTEAALRARDEQIRVIFETSQAGIILVSPEGRITLANRSMAEMLRCSMDELINSSYPDHLHPDQRDTGVELMEKLIRGEIDQVHTERHYQRADGSDFWGYLAGRRYEDRDGNILSLIGIINDITYLRLAEEQAARNISYLEKLESVEKIIRRADDLDTMMMDLLDTVRELFGADRAWLLYPCDPEWPSFQVRMIRTNDQFAIDLKSDDNLPITGDTAAAFRDLLTSDEVMAFDPRTKRHLPYGPEFGTRSQVSVALYPKMSKPWVFGLHQCSHDRTWTDEELRLFNDIGRRVTDGLSSMLLLHTLRESEERLRTLINNMPDIVCFKDGSGRWLEANDFDLRLFQIEGVDYRGKKDSELAAFSSFYREAFLTCEDTDEEAWKKGTVSRGDETIPRPDGTPMVFDIIKVPTFNPDGSRKGLVVVGRDITERTAAEEELKKTAMEKSVLLVELQHRVKNNLGIITSLLNLEMSALNDEQSRKVFRSAISRIQSMSTIYEQLYLSSGIDRINLKQYIEDITLKIYNTYTIVPDNIRLSLDLEEIMIDLKRSVPIGLILNELVTNSLKYAYPDGGKGEVRVILKAGNGSIGITVSDDGVGLPAHFSVKDCPSLGLRLVEMLTDQIDGTVAMDIDTGTTVRITCPA